MRPAESFVGQPIRDLQTMLRVLTKFDREEGPIVPDGIYGQKTAQAVAEFQKKHNMPVTGVTDLTTWEAILDAYIPVRTHMEPACTLEPILNPRQVICKGEKHAHLYLVRGILTVISKRFRAVPSPGFTGTLDEATETSLCSFQKLCGLTVTGTVDKITWKHLALQYPLAASMDQEAPK